MEYIYLPHIWRTVFYNTDEYDFDMSISDRTDVRKVGNNVGSWDILDLEYMKYVIIINGNIICSDDYDNEWYCLRYPLYDKSDGYNKSSYTAFISNTFSNLLRLSFTEKEFAEVVPVELHDTNIQFPQIRKLVYDLHFKNLAQVIYDNYNDYQITERRISSPDTQSAISLTCLSQKYDNYICDDTLTQFTGILPIEIMCNIAEYFSLNDLIGTRSLSKYYYLWTAKEIKKRMAYNDISIVLSSKNSLYFYYGKSHCYGINFLCYQHIFGDCVLSIQSYDDDDIYIVLYSCDRVLLSGSIDLDDFFDATSIDTNKKYESIQILCNNNELSIYFIDMTCGFDNFTVDKNNDLYLEYNYQMYKVCKLSEKMLNIIRELEN